MSKDATAGRRPLPDGLYTYVWQISGRDQIWLTFIAVAVFLLELAPLELQRRVINGALEKRELQLLAMLCCGYVGAVVVQGGLKLFLNVYRGTVGERASRSFRLRTLEAADRKQGSSKEKSDPGVDASIIAAESDPAGAFVGSSVSEPVLHGGALVAVFGYLIVIQPWMALVAIALFVPQVITVHLLQNAINRRTKSRIERLREASADIVAQAAAASSEGANHKEAVHRVDEVYELNIQIYRRKFSMIFLMNLLNHLGVAGILFVGGWFVIAGRTDVGTVVAFVVGLNRVNDPWRDLVTFVRDMTNARVKYRLIASAVDGPNAGERAT